MTTRRRGYRGLLQQKNTHLCIKKKITVLFQKILRGSFYPLLNIRSRSHFPESRERWIPKKSGKNDETDKDLKVTANATDSYFMSVFPNKLCPDRRRDGESESTSKGRKNFSNSMKSGFL